MLFLVERRCFWTRSTLSIERTQQAMDNLCVCVYLFHRDISALIQLETLAALEELRT